MNTSLTVIEGESNIHAKLWESITDRIISKISLKCKNVVFILLGNNAKKKKKLIDSNKHYIIEGIHPSPLSARYNLKGTHKSFFGNNIFNRVNAYLISKNIDPVDWSI